MNDIDFEDQLYRAGRRSFDTTKKRLKFGKKRDITRSPSLLDGERIVMATETSSRHFETVEVKTKCPIRIRRTCEQISISDLVRIDKDKDKGSHSFFDHPHSSFTVFFVSL